MQSHIAHSLVRAGLRQPSGRHKTDRLQSHRAQSRYTAIDPRTSGIVVEREKFAFTIRSSECANLIGERARRPDFIVPLTMQKDLRAIRAARAQPSNEVRVALHRRAAMPIGYDEQAGNHTARGAQLPQRLDARRERRRDVMNRDQQFAHAALMRDS